jgi:hypothetical protein
MKKKEVRIEMIRIISRERRMSTAEEKNIFLKEEIEIQLEIISSMEKTIQQQDRRIEMLITVVAGLRKLLLAKFNPTKTPSKHSLLSRLMRGKCSKAEIEALGRRMRN